MFHWCICVCFYAVPYCFNIVSFEIRECDANSFFVLSYIALAIWGNLWFHINFRNVCSGFLKNTIGMFTSFFWFPLVFKNLFFLSSLSVLKTVVLSSLFNTSDALFLQGWFLLLHFLPWMDHVFLFLCMAYDLFWNWVLRTQFSLFTD